MIGGGLGLTLRPHPGAFLVCVLLDRLFRMVVQCHHELRPTPIGVWPSNSTCGLWMQQKKSMRWGCSGPVCLHDHMLKSINLLFNFRCLVLCTAERVDVNALILMGVATFRSDSFLHAIIQSCVKKQCSAALTGCQ